MLAFEAEDLNDAVPTAGRDVDTTNSQNSTEIWSLVMLMKTQKTYHDRIGLLFFATC